MKTILVTDNQEECGFLDSSVQVVDALSYVSNQSPYKNKNLRVINRCRSYKYQSIGYYVSLLAEARQHQVVPSILEIQDRPGFKWPQRPYRLAILTETLDKTPPSNPDAIQKFIAAGEKKGLVVTVITKKNKRDLSQYDALFIRTTTSVNHYTYQIARRAQREGLVVIDDPKSIIRCTNKIYLADLFATHAISTPPTWLISKYDSILPQIDFPCVLKKPDGSCSKGVIKVDNDKSLKSSLARFFKSSEMLLIQTFMPTPFDWRIGVIDGKPLYACRYYMAKNHWQIVNWNCAIEDDILIHDTVSIHEVPQEVIQLALQATKLIGNGLYGVDIKSLDDVHYVIEVNDNPSINSGIEDSVLNDCLYEKIIDVFLSRLNSR